MYFILFLVAILIWVGMVAAVWLRYIPPLGATTLIHIREGTILVKRGQLRAQAREDAIEVLRGVKKGFIAITVERRVVISREIPSQLHQRLRNVLLNE